MSISKRFIHLVKANLNALLDSVGGDSGLEQHSDEALEAELQRRREVRRQAAHAAEPAGQGRARREPQSSNNNARNASAPRNAAVRERLAHLYSVLESPVGADLATVKRNFRRLMRQHHPDLNAGSPERLRMATERSQQLTQAFTELERHLLARRP